MAQIQRAVASGLCILMGLALANEQAINAFYLPSHMLSLCRLLTLLIPSVVLSQARDLTPLFACRRVLHTSPNRKGANDRVLKRSEEHRALEDKL